MATVNIVFGRQGPLKHGTRQPVIDSNVIASEVLVSAAVSAQSVNSSGPNKNVDVCQITATGGNVWVKFGTTGVVAAPGDAFLVLSGQTREFAIQQNDVFVAVIDG